MSIDEVLDALARRPDLIQAVDRFRALIE